jgi:hypothetical protein
MIHPSPCQAKICDRTETAAARSLGFQDADTARKLAEIPADDALRVHAEWERRKNVELPEHIPGNAGRRSDDVIARAGEAPVRRSEQRTRSVSVGREEVKVETDQYLRQQYTNGDLVQICGSGAIHLPSHIRPFR